MNKPTGCRRRGVISSSYGRIMDILVVLPDIKTKASDEEYKEILATFDEIGTIHKFAVDLPEYNIHTPAYRRKKSGDGDRKINQIMSDVDFAKLLENWSKEITAVSEKGFLTFQRWAQDPFVLLQKEESLIFLTSLKMQRACDFFLPLELSCKLEWEVLIKPIPYYLEGGNVLKGADHLFLGRDLLLQNPDYGNEEALANQISQDTDEPNVVWVGLDTKAYRLKGSRCFESKTHQPLFHLDMFMTIGGKAKRQGQFVEQIFFASPRKSRDLLNALPCTQERFTAELDEGCDSFFQKTMDNLNSQVSFEIIQIPIFRYDDAFFSWNNCLVEVDKEHKRVFLPNYLDHEGGDQEKLNPAFEVLQDEVQQIFERHDFQCFWIGPGRFFRNLAAQGGSLHCITKVLKRERD